MANVAESKTKKVASVFKSPLSSHPRGWCKKINGQVVVICGKVPEEEAVMLYHQRLPVILARQAARLAAKTGLGTQPTKGRITQPTAPPAPKNAGLTVHQLRSMYYAKKRKDIETNTFSARSMMSTKSALDFFTNRVNGPIDALTNEDFASYRHLIARKFEPTTLDRMITQVRAMFGWAHRNHHLPKLPPWGDSFDKVSSRELRRYRQEKQRKDGPKLFTEEQIKKLIAVASPTLKAMILLGINCALGNNDVAELTTNDFNLTTGILDYPRRKTSSPRRSTLWPETVAALKEAIAKRPNPVKTAYGDHVFLTKGGHPVMRIEKKDDGTHTRIDGVSAYFHKLIGVAKIPRVQGVNYYSLRHTFRTVASSVPDTPAIDRIMGHTNASMASQHYIHLEGPALDARLRVVNDHVRNWLYGLTNDPDVIVVSSL